MIRRESIRIPFRYAAGRSGARFLTALRDEGRLIGSHCPACQQVACPARPFCAQCGADTPTELDVGPSGQVVGWTEVPGRGVFGLVLLDGAHTPMLHRLLGPPDRWATGRRVRARLASERTGSVLDIDGFEPDAGDEEQRQS